MPLPLDTKTFGTKPPLAIGSRIFKTIISNPMEKLLYAIAAILIIGWAIGFFAYNANGLIHVLLVIAIIAILLRIISGNKVLR